MANRIRETFAVRGMSCVRCESVIESTLKGLSGVVQVKASFANNRVTVVYDPDAVTFGKIKAAVKKAGYSVEKEQDGRAPGAAEAPSTPLSALQFAGLAVILLALYLLISRTVGFDFIPEVSASMGYGVLFVLGLLTSLHCVAMCGGINLSQCMPCGGTAQDVKAKLRPSLLYNLGRVTSYTIVGGLVGALGSVIGFSGRARGLVAILSGMFMVIMGLSMTGLFPRINKLAPRLPAGFREKAGSAGRGKGPYIVGLLNGLMPCGPLQAMQLYALGTGSALSGALSMLFFSLGTLPLMFGLGAVVSMLGSRFTKKMMKASAVMVAVLGVVMLGRGLVLSGAALPSFGPAPAASSVSSGAAEARVEDGVLRLSSELSPRGYPDITVQKGVPVVWNLRADEKALNGCNRALVIPAYDIQKSLKAGDNIMEFTPTESGEFTYSCWMGMLTGRIRVVDGPSSD